jgi:hypothetical protein
LDKNPGIMAVGDSSDIFPFDLNRIPFVDKADKPVLYLTVRAMRGGPQSRGLPESAIWAITVRLSQNFSFGKALLKWSNGTKLGSSLHIRHLTIFLPFPVLFCGNSGA